MTLPLPPAKQYTRNAPLLETNLAAEPLKQFEQWLADAREIGMIEPGAMMLATVDADGRPSARVVLLKGFYDGGLGFFTHYDSRKARALAAHPFAAATFWWDRLERSVRFEGRIEKLSATESEAYFRSRPRGSQIGAATSRQSHVIDTREALDARIAAHEQQWDGGEIPFPADWGGYRLIPDVIEFWQGRASRVHDRLVYRNTGDGWRIERLEP